MSDVPTQRFDISATPPEGGPAEPEKKSRGLLIALIVIGGVLLIGIVVALILLLSSRGGGTALPSPSPSASATPTHSATPSVTPTSTPAPTPTPTQTVAPPPPSGPTLTSFSGTSTVQCDNRTGNPVPITFSWVGSGAAAYFAVGNTDDPKNNGMGWTLPATGNQTNFPYEYDYPCYNAQTTFSLGVYDNTGAHVVKHFTIKNAGDLHG